MLGINRCVPHVPHPPYRGYWDDMWNEANFPSYHRSESQDTWWWGRCRPPTHTCSVHIALYMWNACGTKTRSRKK